MTQIYNASIKKIVILNQRMFFLTDKNQWIYWDSYTFSEPVLTPLEDETVIRELEKQVVYEDLP